MEQVEQSLSWSVYILPVLLTAIPLLLFYAGHIVSRKEDSPFVSITLHWYGVHGITVVVAATLTLLGGVLVPAGLVPHLPLMAAVSYVLLGFLARSPFLFSVGLATPGLWMFLMKAWESVSGEWQTLYMLPQEPFWYLLGAVLIFNMKRLSTPKRFWENAETALVAVSSGYLVGGFWLLALGQKSLLGSIGLGQWVWAVVLLVISGFLLWCARFLRDPLLAGSGVVGLAGGVYSFLAYYPWGQ